MTVRPRGSIFGALCVSLMTIFVLASCNRNRPSKPTIAVASSFAPAIASIDTVETIVSASGQLTAQIKAGAPIDAIIAAGSDEIDQLDQLGLIEPGSRVVLASNRLVVITPAPRTIASLADLKQFRRVVLADPQSAPLGRYSRQALEHGLVFDQIRDRIIFATNARQVVELVTRGEADAAIVYRSDAKGVSVAMEIDPNLHEPIVYVGAVVRNARFAKEALALLSQLRQNPERITSAGLMVERPATQSTH